MTCLAPIGRKWESQDGNNRKHVRSTYYMPGSLLSYLLYNCDYTQVYITSL